MSGQAVAAIDCGTNSTRLLITVDGVTAVRRMVITRLGAGVDRTRRLDPDAIERVAAALRDFKVDMDAHDVASIRMTATSAARDATNRDEFVAVVRDIIGQEPEIISGREEAELSFAGAVADLDPAAGPYLVVDIGGGSTELAFGTDTPTAAISLDIGSVRLSEQYLDHDPPKPEELVACISLAELHLDDVVRLHPEVKAATTCIGLAGTFSTTAAVEIGLASYDRDRIHHFTLTRGAAEDVFRTLATETAAERLENPGMERGREDIIVGGLCILVKVMRYFDFESVLISEADILDGIAADLTRRLAD